MNGERELNLSVIEPIGPAIERVKEMLFRPFDLGRWFVIGFCAWLAYLPGQFNGGGRSGPNQGMGQMEPIKAYVMEHLAFVIIAGSVGVLLVLGLLVVLTWLSSRGRFMFLHCVAENKAEVKAPWRKFLNHGNSLCLFRICAGLIGFLFFAVFLGGLAVAAALIGGSRPIFLITFIFLFPIAMVFGIAYAVFVKFTRDFVVPLMYLQNCTAVLAWKRFLELLGGHKGAFALYILFLIVINMAITLIIILAACLTMCCAACILSIPYIGTVLFLPVLVFKRAYSLYFLAQLGPEFDVFASIEASEVIEEN